MFGESAQTRLTTNILRGIYMSSNTRLHEAVGKLLVAAKLQEGLGRRYVRIWIMEQQVHL